MNTLLNLDKELFFFINHNCRIDFLNTIMPYWRSMYFWMPLYLFFIVFVIEKYKNKGVVFLMALALTIGVADTVSSKIIKKTIKRARPCHDESRIAEDGRDVKLLVKCGSGFSFTSSHATNHFAMATFVILAFFKPNKRLKITLYLWAASISIGQVYVGVHWPLDIIFGGILGIFIGWVMAILYKRYAEHWDTNQEIA